MKVKALICYICGVIAEHPTKTEGWISVGASSYFVEHWWKPEHICDKCQSEIRNLKKEIK